MGTRASVFFFTKNSNLEKKELVNFYFTKNPNRIKKFCWGGGGG